MSENSNITDSKKIERITKADFFRLVKYCECEQDDLDGKPDTENARIATDRLGFNVSAANMAEIRKNPDVYGCVWSNKPPAPVAPADTREGDNAHDIFELNVRVARIESALSNLYVCLKNGNYLHENSSLIESLRVVDSAYAALGVNDE
jgi:hypothetical protein